MLAYHDRVSIEDALHSNLDRQLRRLMADCLSQTIQTKRYDLTDFTSVIVVEPGDTDDDICCEIGSPRCQISRRMFGCSAGC